MKPEAYKLFDEAVQKLKEANEELYRPEEDVVTFAVCKNAQGVISNYLRGFMLYNGINPDNNASIESLHKLCKSINPKFDEVDLSGFGCKSHGTDSRYCSEVDKVKNCFDIADNLDTFFRREKIINH